MIEAIIGGLVGSGAAWALIALNPPAVTNTDLKIKRCENQLEELKKEMTNLILDFHDLSTRLTRKK